MALGTGQEQQDKLAQRESLLNQVQSVQNQIIALGTGPQVSSALSNLLERKQIDENRVKTSLNLASKLGGVFSSQGQQIMQAVEAGQFVTGTRSTIKTISSERPGSSYGGSRSSFQVYFGKRETGLEQLIQQQKGLDLQAFQAQQQVLQSQLQIAQSNLDIFDSENRSIKDLLTRKEDAVAHIRKKRGRLSLRTKGSRTGLLDESETTGSLLG